MKEVYKNLILYSIAILFLTIVTLTIIFHIQSEIYFSIFWVCYIFLILVPIGIILKKSNLILSQLIILLIPDLIWTIDFIIMLTTGNSPLGFAKFFFGGPRGPLQNILTLHHIFAIPLTISALFLIKPEKTKIPLIIAFSEIILILILGLTFPIFYGINCLPTPEVCMTVIFPKFIPYSIIWLGVMSLFMIISYFIIKYFISKITGK